MSTIEIATLRINSIPYSYKAESLNFNLGLPEINVMVAVNGSTREMIHSPNLETGIGSVKVDIYPSIDTRGISKIEDLITLKNNIEGNAVTLAFPRGKTIRFSNMSMTNPIDVAQNSNGSISLEFKGNPAQLS